MSDAIIEAAWKHYYRRCTEMTGTGYFVDQKTAFAESMANVKDATLEEAAGWQTIESAPANTAVLVGCWLSANRWFQIVAEKVPAEADNWIADNGRITLKPTHWHSLPPPPSADSA